MVTKILNGDVCVEMSFGELSQDRMSLSASLKGIDIGLEEIEDMVYDFG